MKTITQTRGLTNGYHIHRRDAREETRCRAKGFLSQPCNSFKMPAKKRGDRTAGTRTVARRKRSTQSDERIIARHSLPVRIAIYIAFALIMSGVLPMALATFQIYLTDVYGIGAFIGCMAVDVAAICWMVKRHA